MLALALLAVAALAGGHAWCRAGIRPRMLRGLGRVEGLFVRVAAGFVLCTGAGVVLAWAGAFGLRALAVAPAVVFFLWVLSVRTADRVVRAYRSPTDVPAALVVVLLLIVGGLTFFPPFDVRLEARDPGVYYLSGARLAAAGSLTYVDPVVEEMSAEEREYLFPPPYRHAINESYRHIGFYLEERASARVVPQALPVLPVWIAVGIAALGVPGGLSAGSLLGLVAVVAVFFLGRRTFGTVPAALGALLLAGCWVQGWFARYTAAEMPAQLLLAIGFYGLILYRRHGDTGFGLLAAAGLGLSLFAKAEQILLLGPLAMVLVADALRGRLRPRDWGRFWLPLGALVVALLVYARTQLWPYYYDLLQQAGISPGAYVALTVIGAAALVAVAVVARGLAPAWHSRIDAWVTATAPAGRVLRWLAAAALVAGSAWLYWGRPALWEEALRETGRRSGGWEAYNLVELAWALSPAMVLMAVLGMAVALVDRRVVRRGAGAFVFVAVLFTVVFLCRRQIQPMLPWAYRRWLPLTIPWVLLCGSLAMAYAGARLAHVASLRRGRAAAAAAVVIALLAVPVVAHQAPLALRYRSVEEMPGVAGALEQLESMLEPGALVVFEPRTNRGLMRFEADLSLERGYRVVRLPEGPVAGGVLHDLVLRQARLGGSTYLVTTGYLDGLLAPRATPVGELRYETRHLVEHQTWERFQRGLPLRAEPEHEPLTFRAHVYRLETSGLLAPLDGTLDVGGWDDLYLEGEEMHASEVDAEGRTFRWTGRSAGFLLPGMDADATEVVVVADPDKPPAMAAQRMSLSLDGRPLGSVELVEGWREYRFPVPPAWAPEGDAVPLLDVDIDPFFRPTDEPEGSTDSRWLGVKIDRVGWTEAP